MNPRALSVVVALCAGLTALAHATAQVPSRPVATILSVIDKRPPSRSAFADLQQTVVYLNGAEVEVSDPARWAYWSSAKPNVLVSGHLAFPREILAYVFEPGGQRGQAFLLVDDSVRARGVFVVSEIDGAVAPPPVAMPEIPERAKTMAARYLAGLVSNPQAFFAGAMPGRVSQVRF